MTLKYNGFEPKLKFKKKLVRFDQITGTEKQIQGRVGGTASSKIDDMERAIIAEGLADCIQVEVLEYDEAQEQSAVYRLRDGNHRFGAIMRLIERGEWPHGEYIPVTVYESAPNALEIDWNIWQIGQNAHNKKACTPNSDKDLANNILQLLTSERLGKKVARACASSNWNKHQTTIDKAIASAMKDCPTSAFKGLTARRRDLIRIAVYKQAGQNSSPRVIQYDTKSAKVRRVLAPKFNIPYDLSNGVHDDSTGQVVKVVTGNDLHAAVNSIPFDSMLDPTRKNVLILHVTATDPATVAHVRARLTRTVIKRNAEIANPTSGFGLWHGTPMFHEVYFFGQINNEKEGTLKKCAEVAKANENLIKAGQTHNTTKAVHDAQRLADIIDAINANAKKAQQLSSAS